MDTATSLILLFGTIALLKLFTCYLDLKDRVKAIEKSNTDMQENFEGRVDALERGEFKDYGVSEDEDGA